MEEGSISLWPQRACVRAGVCVCVCVCVWMLVNAARVRQLVRNGASVCEKRCECFGVDLRSLWMLDGYRAVCADRRTLREYGVSPI